VSWLIIDSWRVGATLAGIYSFHPASCRKYDHTHQLTVCVRATAVNRIPLCTDILRELRKILRMKKKAKFNIARLEPAIFCSTHKSQTTLPLPGAKQTLGTHTPRAFQLDLRCYNVWPIWNQLLLPRSKFYDQMPPPPLGLYYYFTIIREFWSNPPDLGQIYWWDEHHLRGGGGGGGGVGGAIHWY
jgi:hypothetical protein